MKRIATKLSKAVLECRCSHCRWLLSITFGKDEDYCISQLKKIVARLPQKEKEGKTND